MTLARVETVFKNLAIVESDDNPTNGVRTLVAVLTDGDGGTSNTASVDVTINAVNDAPVLNNSGSPTLTQINEGDVDNAGNSVAEIIASAGGDPITDPDAGAAEGIADPATDNAAAIRRGTFGTFHQKVDDLGIVGDVGPLFVRSQ